MKLQIAGCASNLKRWHGKVADAAFAAIHPLVDDIQPKSSYELWVYFTVEPGATPRLEVRRENRRTFINATFSAANWTTVKSSVPSAASQLASILLELPLASAAKTELRARFADAGLQVVPVPRTNSIGHTDPNVNLMVLCSEPGASRLLECEDALAAELMDRNAGEVTGSGTGAFGVHLDIATQNLVEARKAIEIVLREAGLVNEATVEIVE